ncbi:unnamed protein product [Chironomus riparius]|uniref:Uncharacterized protein n=1 Tax=Chironomus riparius TaxID=315576 RepID=A0A9N9RIS3_9DIPT|nr:unnamed protein product [Chironomus riparius]
MFSSKVFTLTFLILLVSCMVKSESASGNHERVKRQGCENGGIAPYCCENGSYSPYCCENNSLSPYCCENNSPSPYCCENGSMNSNCSP